MRSLFALASAVMLSVAVPAANDQQWPGVFITNQITHYAVHWALVGASGWLSKPECREVFGDFRDQSGNLLKDNLGQLGLDPVTYLKALRFRDGTGSRMCDRPATIMFTSPGSRVVFVCGRQFNEMVREDRMMLSVLVIHEALHTLGLGENPPTSREITLRVTSRCRR
jgi:hypothetical protein